MAATFKNRKKNGYSKINILCNDKLRRQINQTETTHIQEYLSRFKYTRPIGINIWRRYLKLEYPPNISFVDDFIFAILNGN